MRECREQGSRNRYFHNKKSAGIFNHWRPLPTNTDSATDHFTISAPLCAISIKFLICLIHIYSISGRKFTNNMHSLHPYLIFPIIIVADTKNVE